MDWFAQGPQPATPAFPNMDSIVGEALAIDNHEVRDLLLQIRHLENENLMRRSGLLLDLGAKISNIKRPILSMSDIVTVVDAAPDEEAQLQTVLARLSRRGDYNPLLVELTIATIGPHDTDAIIDFVSPLDVKNIKHIKTASGKRLFECTSCEDRFLAKDLVTTPCGHCYCGSCLSMVFDAAVSDESLYPPSCCDQTPIPIEHAKRFLDPEFEKTFEEKGVEFNTVDRTYCSDPTCSTFIPPGTIERATANCLICKKGTCVACKVPSHEGDCPADLELAELLKYAEEMHWQRCYSCLNVVQKREGCNHMDCPCGSSFCYICGRSLDDDYEDELCPCFDIDPPPYRFYKPSTDDSKLSEPLIRTSEWPRSAPSVLSFEVESDGYQSDTSNEGPGAPAEEEVFAHGAILDEAPEEPLNDAMLTEGNDDNEGTGSEEPVLPGIGKHLTSVTQMLARDAGFRSRGELPANTVIVSPTMIDEWMSAYRNQRPTTFDRTSAPSRPGPHRTLRARLPPHRRLQNQ